MRINITKEYARWTLHVVDGDAPTTKDRDYELYERTVGDVAEAVYDVLEGWEERQRHEAKKEVVR